MCKYSQYRTKSHLYILAVVPCWAPRTFLRRPKKSSLTHTHTHKSLFEITINHKAQNSSMLCNVRPFWCCCCCCCIDHLVVFIHWAEDTCYKWYGRCGAETVRWGALWGSHTNRVRNKHLCVCFWRGILAARNSSVSVSSVCVGTVKCRLVLCATDDNDALPQPDTQTYGQTDRQTRYKKHRPWKRSGLSRCENLNQIGIV